MQQPSRKHQKHLHIVEVSDRPHGNADCAGGFTVDAQAEVIDGQAIFVTGAGKADIQFHAGDAQRDLARAGIAETTCP